MTAPRAYTRAPKPRVTEDNLEIMMGFRRRRKLRGARGGWK